MYHVGVTTLAAASETQFAAVCSQGNLAGRLWEKQHYQSDMAMCDGAFRIELGPWQKNIESSVSQPGSLEMCEVQFPCWLGNSGRRNPGH